MHEYSISEDLIDVILNEANKYNAKIVNLVKIKIDPFINANPMQLEFCLRYIAKNTIVENAKFIFDYYDIELQYKNNHKEFVSFNKNKYNDIYSLVVNLSSKKCTNCNELMSIVNKKGVSVESIDID